MQFLLSFHRFRRLLNSATAALSSRIDAHTLAGPQRVFASPQDVSQASNVFPEMSNYHPRVTGDAVELWALCTSEAEPTESTVVAYWSCFVLVETKWRGVQHGRMCIQP